MQSYCFTINWIAQGLGVLVRHKFKACKLVGTLHEPSLQKYSCSIPAIPEIPVSVPVGLQESLPAINSGTPAIPGGIGKNCRSQITERRNASVASVFGSTLAHSSRPL